MVVDKIGCVPSDVPPHERHILQVPEIVSLFLFSTCKHSSLTQKTKMSYQIAYDTTRAPPRGAALVAFMEDFYRTSDTESLHEKYVENFTSDATLIMGPKEAKGTDGMYPTEHP